MASRSIRYLVPIAVAFILARLLYLRQLESGPLLELLTLDAKYYHDWAVRLAQGLGHPQGPFFLSPLYPLFLSAIYSLFAKPEPATAVVFQILLSTGTLIVLYFAVRRLFDNTVAVVTCLLGLLYAPWLYFDGMLLTSSLILFLNAIFLLILAVSLCGEKPKMWLWLVAGGVAGLSALARPSVLFFVLLFLVWLGAKREEFSGGKVELRWLVIPTFLLGTVAILSPVFVRNIGSGGSFLLTTSSVGINFYIGNRVGALGAYEELPWLEASDPQTETQRYRQEAEQRLGRSLTLEQASRYWMTQGLRDIAHHPGAWLKTLARKFWLTIQDGEIRTNFSFAAVKNFCPMVRLMPLTWGFLFPLAMAGLFLCRPWSRGMKLLALYLVAYLLVCVVFFSASEYRFPMILALLPIAGGFLVGIFRALRERRFVRVVAALGIYLIMLIVANFPSKLRGELTAPALDFYNLGCEAVNRDQIGMSIPLFTRALAEKPDFQEAHLELARSLWQVGNFDEARREFEEAGMAPPDSLHGTPLNQIVGEARALYEEGRYGEALSFMEGRIPARSIVPIEVSALRADILERLQRFDAAASLYIQISKYDPGSPEWPYHAALVARQGGDSVTCDSLLTTALGIYPAFAPARLELAANALSRGDTATAVSQLTELRRIRIPVDSIRIRVQDLAKRIAAREHDE